MLDMSHSCPYYWRSPLKVHCRLFLAFGIIYRNGSTILKRPTQHDVARHAGVSRTTVSQVLNKRTNGTVPISDETVQRVWQAIADIGYQPDARAQSLRSGSTHTIGLLIPSIHNPHYWDYVEGAKQAAEDGGYHLLIAEGDLSGSDRQTAASVLGRWALDGLIVTGLQGIPIEEGSPLDWLVKQTPLVDINILAGDKIDQVLVDYYAITLEIVDYLYSLGHRRIGLLYGPQREDHGTDRLSGYRETMQKWGLYDEALIARCPMTMKDGYLATQQLLQEQHPTALITINDMLAIAAIRAATDSGLRIPQDLSIVGYDDIPMAEFMVPRLTTVSKDAVGMGREAAKLLISQLQQPERSSRQHVIIKPCLVVRESTAEAPTKP